MAEGDNAARPGGRALLDRTEQAALVVLALVLVAGIAYRAVRYGRLGAEPLESVPAAAPSYRVNVNAADWVTLSMVPGVGGTLAERIVEQREARGGRFQSLEDLKAVRGIGEKVLARLRPYLALDDPGPDAEPVQMTEALPGSQTDAGNPPRGD